MISAVYEVEVDNDTEMKAGDDAATAKFIDIKELINNKDSFAFDHYDILMDFVNSKDFLKEYLI
jgi:ADP-ribose pyrophosphatase YjhB (NUDIX family)